jgi:chromosome segregation ATPase
MRAALERRRGRTYAALVLACAAAGLFGGCRSAYYSTMETFGVHKRDILVDRVEEGKESQADAQEQFQTTLERFRTIAGVDLGELEDTYRKFESSYEDCEAEAEEVRDRIESIEKVAKDLFREWEAEIEEIHSADLKRRSRENLALTSKRYEQLISAMHRAADKMDPVLVAFKDQVLFLKHDLNARAIAGLDETVEGIEDDVERLIAEMQASIREADAFIGSLQGS